VSYPYRHAITTRWDDNDVYGHVNNVRYFAFFDTAINAFLIERGGLDIHSGEVIGLCVESHCAYSAPIAFPDAVVVGLQAGRIGRSSVRYELGVFRGEAAEPVATGWFVHVFVDRASRRSVPLPEPLRTALAGISEAAPPPD
jgi:acyl-CoA thioester hydrolase